MAVCWPVLAVALFCLGPFARDVARQHGLLAREIDLRRPESVYAPHATANGSALPGNTAENWTLPSASRDSGNERACGVSYHAVLKQSFGPGILFRNQGRPTPYGHVLSGGVRATDGAVPTPMPQQRTNGIRARDGAC